MGSEDQQDGAAAAATAAADVPAVSSSPITSSPAEARTSVRAPSSSSAASVPPVSVLFDPLAAAAYRYREDQPVQEAAPVDASKVPVVISDTTTLPTCVDATEQQQPSSPQSKTLHEEPIALTKTVSTESNKSAESTLTLGSSGSDPFGPNRAVIKKDKAKSAVGEGTTNSTPEENNIFFPGDDRGDAAQRNQAGGAVLGLISSVTGLFGKSDNNNNNNKGDEAAPAPSGVGEAKTPAKEDGIVAEVDNKDGNQGAEIPSGCTGISFDLEQPEIDTVCSTSTEEQSDSAAAAATAGGSTTTIPTKAAADGDNLFAATDPCGASFISEDEDWAENEPVGSRNGGRVSDTKAKALPVTSMLRRHKKRILYLLGLLVLLMAFLGIGIAIGMNIAKGSTVDSDADTASGTAKKPTQKPAPKPTAIGEDAIDGEVPAAKPAGNQSTAATEDTAEEPIRSPTKKDMESSAPTMSPTKKDGSPASPAVPPSSESNGETPSSPTTNTTIDIATTDAAENSSTSPATSPTAAAAVNASSPDDTDGMGSEDGGGDSDAYEPGYLQTLKNGVLLSKGLDCRIIAKAKKKVKFVDGTFSTNEFHQRPDFGATFPTEDGGWVYVSNSEIEKQKGGVGAIYFNKNAKVVDYKMLLKKTSMNCGGGRTPWGSWISCEEVAKDGQIWEVDPLGIREPKQTVLGGNNTGGRFESFTYDARNKTDPRFYYTEDRPDGALRRFRPTNPDWTKPHQMLHGEGQIDYLILTPTASDNSTGTYEWTKKKILAKATASAFFPGSEGIDAYDESLYFVSKKLKMMYILDLDGNTWERQSTKHGVFDGGPDQITRLVGEQEILYYTEEGGQDAGIHGRDSNGNFFSILESPVYNEETTGLAFSPDHMRMYLAYQVNGVVLDVWRKDGRPFSAKSLNIKYHNMDTNIV